MDNTALCVNDSKVLPSFSTLVTTWLPSLSSLPASLLHQSPVRGGGGGKGGGGVRRGALGGERGGRNGLSWSSNRGDERGEGAGDVTSEWDDVGAAVGAAASPPFCLCMGERDHCSAWERGTNALRQTLSLSLSLMSFLLPHAHT